MDIFRPAEVRPFRYWCQKVLPLVYDDSLSYYELLCKVVKYLNDMADTMNTNTEQLEKVISALTALMNGNTIISLVETTLDKMVEDGTLDDALARVALKINTYKALDNGWVVEESGDSITMSQQFMLQTNTTQQQSGAEHTIYATGQKFMLNLAMPLRDGSVVGSLDSYWGFSSDMRVPNGTTVQFRPVFLDRESWTDEQPINFSVNIIAKGIRRAPNETPYYPVSANRSQVIAIADTYYQSVLNGRKWIWGSNFVTNRTSNVVNDDNGYGRLECDAFVALVMMGVPYESSPYYDTTAGKTFEFDGLTVNPNGYSWCLPWKTNDILGRKVTWTGGENWWLWSNNMTFSYLADVADGDIVIFTKKNQKYFDHISHIGIMKIQTINGERVPYIYHFTGSNLVDTPMRFEPFMDVVNRSHYDVNRDIYFARPNYNA